MSEVVPAWLARWREEQAAQPETLWVQRAAPARARAKPAAPEQPAPAAAPRAAHPLSRGFTEPTPWGFDGCARREPVLDHDRNPPRVVRRVGWQRCMRCRSPFWSEDVVRLRLCAGTDGACRDDEDRFVHGEPGQGSHDMEV